MIFYLSIQVWHHYLVWASKLHTHFPIFKPVKMVSHILPWNREITEFFIKSPPLEKKWPCNLSRFEPNDDNDHFLTIQVEERSYYPLKLALTPSPGKMSIFRGKTNNYWILNPVHHVKYQFLYPELELMS